MPVDQPGQALDRLRRAGRGLSPWELTALHDLVSLTGSLVLGLAVAEGALRRRGRPGPSRRIDEDWQIAQWGERRRGRRAAAERRRGDSSTLSASAISCSRVAVIAQRLGPSRARSLCHLVQLH